MRPPAWHRRPRVASGGAGDTGSELEVGADEGDVPHHPDEDFEGGIAIDVAVDVGGTGFLVVAELTLAECIGGGTGVADPAEGLVAPGRRVPDGVRLRIDAAEVDLVAFPPL